MNLTIVKQESSLSAGETGEISLQLVQSSVGAPLVGERNAIGEAQRLPAASEADVENCRKILSSGSSESLTVLSYHPGILGIKDELAHLAMDRTIVALGGSKSNQQDVTFIASKGKLLEQPKISLSSEDRINGISKGNYLYLFSKSVDQPELVSWAVLNCHDYTDVRLLRALQDAQVELVVVVAYNPASRLFWKYAIADMHRLFSYIAIANVAEFGGSGVFAPFRRIGRQKHAQISAAGQLFGSRGNAEFAVNVALDIEELRLLRSEFSTAGFESRALQRSVETEYTPMVPSEHFLHTFDRGPGAPVLNQESVIEKEIDWNSNGTRIAVAQLNHLDVYVESRYRIRNHPSCADFEQLLDVQLLELETRCRALGATQSGSLLDFLVLPEVFVPRTYIHELQRFSKRLGATIVAGVDYPGTSLTENANECIVICPDGNQHVYRKITRSQYDAVSIDAAGRMKMERGGELFRFRNADGYSFGVLICYDFSHLDLVEKINIANGREPLHVLMVIAHNPFGELYRSCCIADAHRFYQYVVMSNVAKYGGSGVFAPCRTAGSRQVLAEAGKNVETIALLELDLPSLRVARHAADSELRTGTFMRKPGLFLP